MTSRTYPQNPEEWQSTIQDEIDLSFDEGQKAFQEGNFPYEQLEQWIRKSFSKGFSPDFVPALLRNIRRLVAWVYGDGNEPYWPGSDDKAITG